MTPRKIKITMYLILVILLIFFIGNKFKQKSLLSPLKSFENNSFKEVVEKSLDGVKGTYGVVVKNLKNGESFYFNEHKIFEPGSLYKIWVMAEVFNQIQNGVIKEDEVLSEDASILNEKFNISSESAEIREGEITLSVKEALDQMITISHNYAALLLTERVKLSKVASFLIENGFNESKVGTNGETPTTTPSDMALFFEKLYKGILVNKEYSQEMIDLLKAQTLNDKLPKYLPDSVGVAHKTGEIEYYSHDAGIVFTPKGDYIIVILSESDYPPGAEERIAQISKAVYDYFNRE